jgi:hypothetical protein
MRTPSASSEPHDDDDDDSGGAVGGGTHGNGHGGSGSGSDRRRRRRNNPEGASDDERDEHDDDDGGDAGGGQDEDDAVRCICGSEDYPGLPVFTPTAAATDARHAADAAFYNVIELNEDVVGFFLQCDTCKVWQHGACVGITSTESSPDEYFCEQCRKDLHRIHADSNG